MKKSFLIFLICLMPSWGMAQGVTPRININNTGVYLSDFSVKQLENFYKSIDYNEYINLPNDVYPRVFVKNFPADYASYYEDLTDRNRLFIKILMPLVLKINEEILEERADLEAIRDGRPNLDYEDFECDFLENMAKKYDVVTPFKDTRRCMKLMTELLKKVDMIPPSILVAAAAIHTDWGTSRVAIQGNNLFQMKNWYSDEGLEPLDDPGEPYRFKVYPSLEESLRDYALKVNSNVNYLQFRDARAVSRRLSRIMFGKRLDWAFVLDNNLQNYAGLLDYTLTFYRFENLDMAELEQEYELED